MSLTTPEVTDLLTLTGRTAVVTGGAMGIGRAIAERLAEAGAQVVLADVDEEAVTATAKDLAEDGSAVTAVAAEVGDEESVRHLIQTAVGWGGGIDILVNNAGIFPTVPVLEMTAADFDRVLTVNLRGVYLCSRYAALQMREQETGGRIVNITSVDAVHPSGIGLAHYDASKHGVWGFTKNLALELAPHGIWVNAIAPGAIATPGVARMQAAGGQAGVDPEQLLAGFLSKVPAGRMGVPDDIARVALFLASDLASYLTGSQIVVDGGFLLS